MNEKKKKKNPNRNYQNKPQNFREGEKNDESGLFFPPPNASKTYVCMHVGVWVDGQIHMHEQHHMNWWLWVNRGVINLQPQAKGHKI